MRINEIFQESSQTHISSVWGALLDNQSREEPIVNALKFCPPTCFCLSDNCCCYFNLIFASIADWCASDCNGLWKTLTTVGGCHHWPYSFLRFILKLSTAPTVTLLPVFFVFSSSSFGLSTGPFSRVREAIPQIWSVRPPPPCSGLNSVPPNFYPPRTSECDLIWKFN